MARNGSGTMNPSATFSANTTASASAVNAVIQDIADEITNSVALDGQSAMTGQFKADYGSAAAPGYTFDGDVDLGFYRSAADAIGLSIGGTLAVTFDSTGITLASGKQITGAFFTGMVSPYAGSSAPTGWLLCYGQAVSRTTYADLFAIVGTTYGAGNGSTTFNLPDLRGRVVAGRDNMGGTSANRLTDQSGGLDGDTLGDTGGAETHTLTEAQLAAHDHTVTDSGHTHSVADPGHSHTIPSYTNNFDNNRVLEGGDTPGTVSTSSATTGVSIASATTGVTVNDAGSGDAHNNVQPTIILNYIIKT